MKLNYITFSLMIGLYNACKNRSKTLGITEEELKELKNAKNVKHIEEILQLQLEIENIRIYVNYYGLELEIEYN